MAALFKQMWVRVFHLEGRLFRSLRDIFIPGKISVEFFKGKQKRYPPPVQFLFVVMFFFIFTFNHLIGTGGVHFQTNKSGVNIEERKEKFDLYATGRQYTEVRRMWQAFDSLPTAYRTPVVREALDSILRQTHGNAADKFSRALAATDSTNAGVLDSLPLSLGFHSIKIATQDIFQLEPDAIIERYRIESWVDKVLVRQGIKTMKTPDALVKTYLGSLVWTILALIAVLSPLLALLYRKQHRYYVEHFVFLLYQHTALFLVLTVVILINYFLPLPLWFWISFLLWLTISQLLAMKRFYGQSGWQTLWKWLLFSSIYLIGFVVLFTAGTLVVFFLF